MSASPRVLVLGGRTGLLGQALVHALRQDGWDVVPTGRQDFEILDSEQLAAYVEDVAPEIIFNTVAWTQVDLGEDRADDAFALNAALPEALGSIIKGTSTHLFHFSTDFVFDGRKGTPYTPADPTAPLCVYGASKLAGEQALIRLCPANTCIVRTAWLFGPGRRNFVQTILDLAQERDHLQIVADQVGSPTYTLDLAAWSTSLACLRTTGVLHLANSGQASWFELASRAVALAGFDCKVTPIPSSSWPQKATRPLYSVLDNGKFADSIGIKPRKWQDALQEYISEHYFRT